MIRIAIVEDEQEIQKQLLDYIKRYEQENKIVLRTDTFWDGDEIAEEYSAAYDIIFLDIQMKRMDGMKAAEKIRKLDASVIIIFITNMANYAIHGYAVGAMDFILKPVPYFAFSQELQKAVSRLQSQKKNDLLLSVEDGMIKLDTSQILYMESISRRLMIHTPEQEYLTAGTLKDMEKKLKGEPFLRCNNCYLVNLACVEGIRQNMVIVHGAELQISRPRKKVFMEALADYVGGMR